MFSLLWSEHCAYKHSKKLLRTLPTEGPQRRHGPGRERRRGRRRRRPGGRVQGRVAQPPERGRAVPGRGHRRRRDPARHLRDRRAADRGARLAALRRARRSARSRYLLDRAVAGIGHYGNSIGVPTVGGEVYFEGPYEQNCLVNAMALGLARADDMIRSAAAGVGNVLVLFGASTGRDGIGGASVLASRRARRGRRGQAPDRPGRRPVRGEEAARVLARAARARAARLAAGPRRRGPDLVARRRWRPRARSASTSTSRACRCARPTWSRSRSWSPSRRSGCSASSSPRASTRCSRVCEKWEVHGTAIGDGHRHARTCASATATQVVGDMPVAALVDDCPLYDLAPGQAVRAAVPRAAARCSTPTRPDARSLLALLRLAEHRLAPAALPAVRLARAVAHRAPARAGRRRRAAAAGGQRDRDVDRRQRPPGRRRPVLGDGRRRARVRGEPRVRRRRAARHDEQPELRQPREAAHRLAAHRGRARPRRRVPRARRADRRRQRLALQRGRRRARSTRRRSSAWSASCPTPRAPGGSGFAREGDAVGARGPVRTPSLAGVRAGQAARRGAARRAARGRRRPRVRARSGGDPRRRPRRRRSSSATTSPRAACSSRSPSAAWPAARRDARRSATSGRRPSALLFGEGPGGFVVSGPARGARARSGERIPLDVFGDGRRRRAGRSTSDGGARWSLDELREAHGALGAALPVARSLGVQPAAALDSRRRHRYARGLPWTLFDCDA